MTNVFLDVDYVIIHPEPSGSKDPNDRAPGPKYPTINGSWDLKRYSLGPWTLRGSLRP